MYVAHSATPLCPEGQPLREHLRNVADYAASRLNNPLLRDLAALEGLCHDAGKYADAVQDHILHNTADRPDHASLGARLAVEACPRPLKNFLAPPMLGHHGGMPDGPDAEARLAKPLPAEAAAAFRSENAPRPVALSAPPMVSRETAAFEMYMAGKMLHSALVDGDYLDTEAYFEPDRAARRRPGPPLAELWRRYQAYMDALPANPALPINRLRDGVRRDCLTAAEGPQGIYSLTVPTGGGKTLSSLGFALRHAMEHKSIRRVIYAIPYTSIIEQNAAVFAACLGADAVLEHHSAVRAPEDGRPLDWAAENWDAPVIVTTNVQLFESIFSNKPSRARKIHNIADSVLILDEMQALPDGLLRPCLAALDALAKDYRVTVVICTATQPDYDRAWPERPHVTEIASDPRGLYKALRRTRAIVLGTLSDDALIDRLREERQALVIVNNRRHARTLCEAMGGEARHVYHLSTMMCARHRTEKLARVRALLSAGEECLLISTSLIEAGVDIDFPAVYRAAAGLDSVVQAAGRCNREGRSSEPGPVYVFTPEQAPSPPETKRLAGITLGEIAPLHQDLLSPEAVKRYFGLRFGAGAELDRHALLPMIDAHKQDLMYPYETVARRFAMIESAGEPVYVPYDGEARDWMRRLEEGCPLRDALRGLRGYGVNLYPNQLGALRDGGHVRRVRDVWLLDAPREQEALLYSDAYGLDASPSLSPLMP